MVNEQGNIRVIYDESNVIYIDPNKLILDTGEIIDRAVKPENFVMYANLETTLIPRTKLLIGGAPNNSNRNILVGSLNFLKPNTKDNYFTSSYYDEFTGKNSLANEGTNQKTIDIVENDDNPYFLNSAKNIQDNTLLGIKNISIKTNSSFIPTVTITMEDIQGRGLFSLGNDSPYAAFFNLPYPPFYLTIKGYYGKAVRYELVLSKFNASFNTNSGDYTITLDFLGYKYNVLTDINVGHLIAAPNMYTKKYEVTQNKPNSLTPSQIANISNQTINQTQSSIGNKSVFEINTHIGYQKIIEVYKEYKSKGLIDANLPEMTLTELIYKLEMFEQNVLNSLNKVDVQKLTDGKLYKKVISSYYKEVRGNLTSWVNKYLDPNPIILSDTNDVLYGVKKEYMVNPPDGKLLLVESDLDAIIKKYNLELANNNTFGVNGTSAIVNNINYNMFIADNPKIDWCATYKSRNKSISVAEVISLTDDECSNRIKNNIYFNYTLDGVSKTTPIFTLSKFIDERNRIESKFINELNNIEKILSQQLALKIEKKETGIGFKPTIKNIVAVILATTEGFLRLMEDVHTSAWGVRNDSNRIQAVLGEQNIIKDDNYEYEGDTEKTVFPWPLVYYTNDKKDANKYELIYPGDPTIINTTKAYLYDVWPEVEFVEEYLKGYSKRLETPSQNDFVNTNTSAQNGYAYSSIEYPFLNIPYELTNNVNFFYEFWDRLILNSYYSGFASIYKKNGNIGTLIKENEYKNIENGLSTNSIIFLQQLKNILFSEGGLNYDNFNSTLKSFSTGASEKYNKYLDGAFNTKYILDEINAPSKIYNINEYLNLTEYFTNNLTESKINVISDVIRKSQDTNNINFTYPFTNTNWTNDNLINLFQNKFDTKDTLFFNSKRNIITNFKEYNEIVTNRPFKYFPTEKPLMYGNVFQDNYGVSQSMSIINSPIFINSIQVGMDKWRIGNKHPYIASAYLFLNSLPLSPLTGFFANRGDINKNGHVFSTFIKYGAIHKLPYAWILKYGSIWHRYKNFTNTGVDFLDEVWKDFDYKKNYNEVNSDFQYNINGGIPIKLRENNQVNLGFYPKLLNDFNGFLNGYDLFSGFTNNELSVNENRGFKVIKSLTFSKSGLTFNGYTTIVPQNIYDSSTFSNYCDNVNFNKTFKHYVLPSINNNVITAKSFANTNNSNYESIDSLIQTAHNGAISLTMQDEYNSFTFKDLKKPLPTEYLNGKKDINAFSLVGGSNVNYASIEDIFSVFDYETLNLFETEFLKFSKSIYDIDDDAKNINLIDLDFGQPIAAYKNFQFLFRNIMEIPSNYLSLNDYEFYKQSSRYQEENITNFLNNFLNYDILFKFGNPTQYNRYSYNSLINHLGGASRIQNPKRYSGFIPNSLVTNTNSLQTLRLHIGFSTIDNLKYTNANKSYITDFFIDNNIEFNSTNIIELAKPIKIYATQKLNNPNFTKQEFLTLLVNNQNSLDTFLEDNVNETLGLLARDINNIDIVEVNNISSILDSKFSKYDLYEDFKSINDKWISSSDYTSRTLFEDVLFLDRGGRNIGDLYYVDIFDLKKVLTGAKANLKTSVFNFIAGILVNNNFNVFPMPSYVNFYGALSPRDDVDDVVASSTNIANDVWGNYVDVDYRKSGPKLVCVFAGRGSTTPNGPKDFRFGDDAIDLLKPSKIPFLEDQTNKEDWSQSNKCVSFLVDAGIRNQAIFYGIQVDQNNGTATAESLIQQENMRNVVSNRSVSTQSVSLFNLYKNLSYKSTITCFGNAIIQPTMYYNLEHIPMFGGPYFITEVSHSIAPGTFETTFTGVRQSIYAPPSTDSYLTSINENLLSKIESNYSKSIKNDVAESSTQTNNTQTGGSTQVSSTSCSGQLFEDYKDYELETTQNIVYSSSTEVYAAIIKGVGNNNIADNIYLISYLSSFESGKFKANHNNFGNIWLTYNRAEITQFNGEKELYYCAQNNYNTRIQTPFALFSGFETYLKFMQSQMVGFSSIVSTTGVEFVQAYIANWLYSDTDPKLVEVINNLKTNGFYNKLNKKYTEAQQSLRALKGAVELTEKQKEELIDPFDLVKLSSPCEYTYNNIKVNRIPAEPEYAFPYNLNMFFETKNLKELLYLESINKTIEDTLVSLYILEGAPIVSSFDVKVKSGATLSINVNVNIVKEPNNIPYTGFKFVAESGDTATNGFLVTNAMFTGLITNNPNFSFGNQDIEDDDKIGNIISHIDNLVNIKYIAANYTKLILYPKLN